MTDESQVFRFIKLFAITALAIFGGVTITAIAAIIFWSSVLFVTGSSDIAIGFGAVGGVATVIAYIITIVEYIEK